MADYEDPEYNKPVSLSVWKKMIPFIAPQKLNLIRCAVLMLSAAVVDVFLPLILGYAIRHNIEPRSSQGMWGLLGVALVMILVQGINVRFFVSNGIRA